MPVSDLNRLEMEMLKTLQFTVGLKASLYCKYYFDLRTLVGDSLLPEVPLSVERAKRLETKTELCDGSSEVQRGPSLTRSEGAQLSHEAIEAINRRETWRLMEDM